MFMMYKFLHNFTFGVMYFYFTNVYGCLTWAFIFGKSYNHHILICSTSSVNDWHWNAWWRHNMETLFALLHDLFKGIHWSPVHNGARRSSDVFFGDKPKKTVQQIAELPMIRRTCDDAVFFSEWCFHLVVRAARVPRHIPHVLENQRHRG